MSRPVCRRRAALLPALVVLAGLAAGCLSQKPAQAQTQIFAMDTVMSLTLYGQSGEEETLQAALTGLTDTIYTLQNDLSVTDQGSELWALNQAGGEAVSLSPDTADLLSRALELCELTGGALDITAYPAVKAWGFTTGSYRVPGGEELEQLAANIDYTRLELDPEAGTARLPQGMELDLGAVAKGYAGGLLTAQLEQAGVDSALLDLGQSTIQTVGSKPDGSPWRIGIQDPAGESYLGVVELSGQAMGTSGGYQRCFEENGVRYWHILDPDTAAPARSGLSSVTVVGPDCLVCDGLSTALFVLGEEAGLSLWRDHPELEAELLLVREDGSLVLTSGLEENFSLAEGQEGREVTVVS